MNDADRSGKESAENRESPESGRLELVAVASLYDEGTAEVLRVILEEEGIACHIENAHQGGLTGVLPVRLLVRRSDADRAARILETSRQSNDFPEADD